MSKYEEVDWSELPDDIKSAATILGYTEKKWDGDKTPKTCDKYWRKLTDEQKEAATTLGYTEETWDDDDDSDSDSD